MQVKQSSLLQSAVKKEQWPQSELPELIMVGRSNAGKSSFINALCNRKNLAYVGKQPGKTRILNFFLINKDYVLVDAPGYGYAVASQKTTIDFGDMMEEYFQSRSQCKGMVMILDIRRKPSQDDITMLEYARYYQVPCLCVLTKADKVSNNEKAKQKQIIASALRMDARNLVVVSSEKKVGIEQAWERMEELLKQEG